MGDGFFEQGHSERLFSSLSYAVFVAPGAVVVAWMLWRVMAWCLFHAAALSAWLGQLPAVQQVPIAVGLLLLAWPFFGLALVAWIVVRLVPRLAIAEDRAPRVFARATSPALSSVFLFCLVLPLVFVPMRYLADRIEGPKILLWHWLLVVGAIAVLAAWAISRAWRRRDRRSRL